MASTTVQERIERLSAVSARQLIEPDTELAGAVGPGQVLPDELLSVRDLGLTLSPEQARRLATEEVAALNDEGTRFESILAAGFSLEIQRADLREPWVVYALHEIGEETRHSRLFIHMLGQLRPEAVNPFNRGVLGTIKQGIVRSLLTRRALLYTLVLAGEEIPDLFQKRTSEHPRTDPFIARVSRYHRHEEARHIAFARLRLPELMGAATRRERFLVRRYAPFVISAQLGNLFHPGIYETIGLPGWRTWWRVHRSAYLTGLRHEGTRPILRELLRSGAIVPGRVPRPWRRLAGTDRHGRPVATASAVATGHGRRRLDPSGRP